MTKSAINFYVLIEDINSSASVAAALERLGYDSTIYYNLKRLQVNKNDFNIIIKLIGLKCLCS